jgi:hypothetical protein
MSARSPPASRGQRAERFAPQPHLSATSAHSSNLASVKQTPGQLHRHHDGPAGTGPAVEVHGRVVTTTRRAAAFYRHAQRAVDAHQSTTALRLAVNADPTFGLAIADLDALTGTAGEGPPRRQMNWERHHIEVVRTASAGNANRAVDLLREHLASVGCDPLAVRIAVHLRHPRGYGDDFEELIGQLPSCHATPWPSSK